MVTSARNRVAAVVALVIVLTIATLWTTQRHRRHARLAEAAVAETAQCRLWAQAIDQWRAQRTMGSAEMFTAAQIRRILQDAAEAAGISATQQLTRLEPHAAGAGGTPALQEIEVTLVNVTARQWITFLHELHTRAGINVPTLQLAGGPADKNASWKSVTAIIQYRVEPPVDDASVGGASGAIFRGSPREGA